MEIMGVVPQRPWYRRPLFYAAVVLLLIAVAVALALFQPWKLWVDQSVDEPLPAATAAPAAAAPSSDPSTPSTAGPAPVGPVTVAGGRFRSLEHPTTGTASLITVGSSTVLRLADLDTSNGPDLRVWLSPEPATNGLRGYRDAPLELGRLKGNQGNQNYTVPAGTDLTRYKSTVIWCKRFGVGFGVAPLTPV